MLDNGHANIVTQKMIYDQLQSNSKSINNIEYKTDRIHDAVFGNDTLKEKGIKSTVDELEKDKMRRQIYTRVYVSIGTAICGAGVYFINLLLTLIK